MVSLSRRWPQQIGAIVVASDADNDPGHIRIDDADVQQIYTTVAALVTVFRQNTSSQSPISAAMKQLFAGSLWKKMAWKHNLKHEPGKIKNLDNLCCARALAVARAYVDNDPHLNTIRKLHNTPNTMQKRLATQLMVMAGLGDLATGCGYSELEKLQTALSPDYQIKTTQETLIDDKTFLHIPMLCVARKFDLKFAIFLETDKEQAIAVDF
uniref:Uncharacterized protein n=1 Tax=Romanomermis culicivorax TaxID=13658 RepID=A0A915KAZ1_ROMCU